MTLRSKARLLGAGLAGRVRRMSYLRKWLLLGAVLGVIAGLGAVLFYTALHLATELFMEVIAGYRMPTPLAEGNVAGLAGPSREWLLPLIVAAGGLLSGILVFTFAPEAEGHGTDAAISAVHHNPRGVRVRAVAVKIVASALTIGAGGSGGREGPTAQISAGFGSLLARVLDLSPQDGRIAVSVGIGSGIGSIFGAPLGGALLAAELLYREDMEVQALIPGMIASVIGYAVFSAFYGFTPLFGFAGAGYHLDQPLQLLWFAPLGVLCGAVGLLYAKSFYGGAALFARLRFGGWRGRRQAGEPGPSSLVGRIAKPALGGLAVGLIALAMPQVLGTGYGWIQKGLGHALLSIPLWIVLLLPFAKILATTLSIGSGGSGGIFGPGMVIGAFVGAACWRLLEPIAPGIPHDPAAFTVVAMMACFGSIARAPLAVMVMVAEMTGSLQVLAPAMVAVGLATLLVTRFDETIYRSQLRSRSDEPGAHAAQAMPMAGSILVREAMGRPALVVEASWQAGRAQLQMQAAGVSGAPVVDEHGVYVGVLDRLSEGSEPDRGSAGRLADPTAPAIEGSWTLDDALQALASSGRGWLPVLDEAKRVCGMLGPREIADAHRAALEAIVSGGAAGSSAKAGTSATAEDVSPSAV